MLFVPLYMWAGAWDAGFGIQGWHTLATNPHLAREPWLSGWRGAVWIHAMAAVPWVALIVAAGLRSVEAELEEDALLRMPAYQVVRRVTLRRAAAAIVVAAIWIAIVASAEISVTDVYQYRTFAEEVYTQAVLGAFDFAPADDAALAAASQAAAARERRKLEFSQCKSIPRFRRAACGLASRCRRCSSSPRSWPAADCGTTWSTRRNAGRGSGDCRARTLARRRRALDRAVRRRRSAAGQFDLQGGRPGPIDRRRPRSQLVADQSRRRRRGVAPWQYRDELWQSAEIGAAAATAALLLGVPLAWSMRGNSAVCPGCDWAAIALLMAVPGPLLGIAMIRLLNQPPDSPLACLAWLYDTNFAPWLVQTLRALPIVTLILWPALASVPQAMLDTAATDGAGWWRRLLFIVIPQRWPALVAAWLVGLAVAVGELAATVLVVPPGPTTISVRIFSLIHYGVDDRVASICLVLVLGLAALTLLGVQLAAPRRPRRGRKRRQSDRMTASDSYSPHRRKTMSTDPNQNPESRSPSVSGGSSPPCWCSLLGGAGVVVWRSWVPEDPEAVAEREADAKKKQEEAEKKKAG